LLGIIAIPFCLIGFFAGGWFLLVIYIVIWCDTDRRRSSLSPIQLALGHTDHRPPSRPF